MGLGEFQCALVPYLCALVARRGRREEGRRRRRDGLKLLSGSEPMGSVEAVGGDLRAREYKPDPAASKASHFSLLSSEDARSHFAVMVLSKQDKILLNSCVGKINPQSVGSDVLARMFASYPQTKVYFTDFTDYTIKGQRVQKHGLTVMSKIVDGIKNLDDLRGFLDVLSAKHANELMVDPVNFGFLGNCVVTSLAATLTDFTPEMHCAWDKYMCEFAYLLAEKYR